MGFSMANASFITLVDWVIGHGYFLFSLKQGNIW